MTSSQTTPSQADLAETLTIHDIKRADAAIRPAVLETPLLTSDRLNAVLPFDLYLKAESLQRTGSFKFRGAYNAVFGLEDPDQAVIAFSSGNHAQAVALAAKLAARHATIIMPKDAPAGVAAITSAREILMPSTASKSIILRIRGIRVSRDSANIFCILLSSPSNNRPSICTLIPSRVSVEISAPNTKESDGRSAVTASLQPEVLS